MASIDIENSIFSTGVSQDLKEQQRIGMVEDA